MVEAEQTGINTCKKSEVSWFPLYGPDMHAMVMRALECNLLLYEVRWDSIANVTWCTFQKTGSTGAKAGGQSNQRYV